MYTPETITRAELDQVVKDWRAARAERSDLQKMVDKAKELEDQLKTLIIDAIQAQGFEGVVVDNRITQVTEKKILTIENAQELEKFIFDNHALDILTLRVSKEAVEARRAEGIEVPGLGEITQYNISDKKVG